MILYCATTNAGKLREFARAAPPGVALQPVPDLGGVSPPEETGATFRENAILKAEYYSRTAAGLANELVLAEDSGLEVDALAGAPGVRSARFAGEGATEARNNALLLRRMANASNRRARFVCAAAVARDGRLLACFEGATEGCLLDSPRGAGGFGYDPLFFSPQLGCTFAEASAEQKLSVSHRGAALAKMFRWLATTAAGQ